MEADANAKKCFLYLQFLYFHSCWYWSAMLPNLPMLVKPIIAMTIAADHSKDFCYFFSACCIWTWLFNRLQQCFNAYLEKLPDVCKYNDTVAVILISKEVRNLFSDTKTVKVKSIRIRFRTQKSTTLSAQLLKNSRINHPDSNIPLPNQNRPTMVRLLGLLPWV